jgi:hypothetical protein
MGAVMAFAPAAQAKGDMVPTSGLVVITGPGLAAPIARSWRGSCFMFLQGTCSKDRGYHRESQGFPPNLGQVSGPFWSLATQSNFLSQVGGHVGSFNAPAGAAELGPKYLVTWTVTMANTTHTVVQDLYPYGPAVVAGLPRVPWSYTAKGQSLAGSDVSWGWMPTLSTYLDELVALGLPATAPPMPPIAPPAHPAQAPAQPAQAPGHAPAARHAPPTAAWPVALGVGLLLAALIVAAKAGRPRTRVQAA